MSPDTASTGQREQRHAAFRATIDYRTVEG
jgi:hypothetical protein